MTGEPDRKRWSGPAPAKVNLFLRLLAREEGGYHQIETLFQALELADEVSLEARSEAGIRLEVEGVAPGALGPDEHNLAVRAARAYLKVVNPEGWRTAGLRIALSKRIPHGAGLGGGSSDAAAVLRGLDAMWGNALGLPRLVRLGASLGADVPFFVSGASRALAWGRGDRLLALAPLPSRPVVVAVPREGMPTERAYGLLAAARSAQTATSEGDSRRAGGTMWSLDDLGQWEGVIAGAENAFEEVVEGEHPEVARLRKALSEAGASLVLLAGSGSAVFGVFPDEVAAEGGEVRIAEAAPRSRVIRTRTAV